MNEMAVVLVPALGTALLHFLWQGVLIGLVAWLLLLVLRDARPQARYAVACIALLACVAAPLASVCLAFLGSGAAEAVPAAGRPWSRPSRRGCAARCAPAAGRSPA